MRGQAPPTNVGVVGSSTEPRARAPHHWGPFVCVCQTTSTPSGTITSYSMGRPKGSPEASVSTPSMRRRRAREVAAWHGVAKACYVLVLGEPGTHSSASAPRGESITAPASSLLDIPF